jgi:Carboxypeptidase regulatory-like domain
MISGSVQGMRKRKRSRCSFRGQLKGLSLCLFALLALWAPRAASAQDNKAEAQLRTVHGIVVDADENPIPSGIVYLLNVKTQSVKTYIADQSGNYRFSGLDSNVDYELHAEHDDLTSATRTVSSFNASRDIEVILKVSHKKKPH